MAALSLSSFVTLTQIFSLIQSRLVNIIKKNSQKWKNDFLPKKHERVIVTKRQLLHSVRKLMRKRATPCIGRASGYNNNKLMRPKIKINAQAAYVQAGKRTFSRRKFIETQY